MRQACAPSKEELQSLHVEGPDVEHEPPCGVGGFMNDVMDKGSSLFSA